MGLKSNCDKTQVVKKLKLWQNSNGDTSRVGTNKNCDKNQIVKKKLKHPMWQNSNCDKTQELILLQNSKTEIVTKPEIWQISIYEEKNCKRVF